MSMCIYPLDGTGARRRRMSTQAVTITFAKNYTTIQAEAFWFQMAVLGITPGCKLAVLK